MPTLTSKTGTCLCGAMQLTVTPKSLHVGACHCEMCRRWGGGPMMAVECEGRVAIKGEDFLTVYSSSDWAERGFCKACGTHLFYRLKQGGHVAMPVGLFDDQEGWTLSDQVFIDEKPGFYSFAQATRDLTGEELFSQFTGE